jgi:DHA1 family bicyclomycin/chloramphenicol resistance-like MFS transporter
MTQPVRAVAAGPVEGEVRQRLGNKGLIAFLTLLSAFVPLSTDLYLPALPGMTKYFGVPEYQTNLTLLLFLVFYGLATLVWGPLSDRYGRRPILLIGLSGYAVAGALCALSTNVLELAAFRVVQAIGVGAASAIATAIIKDVYRGRKRETTLALVSAMVVISPAVAPIIGAALLNLTSWRGVFVLQAALGVLVGGGAVVYQETLAVRNEGNAFASLWRLGTVLKNPVFSRLLLVFSLLSIINIAFITSSSYIYEQTFGRSVQVYSYFFAIWAVGLACGPLIYLVVSKRVKRTSILTVCFGGAVVSGVLTLLVGESGPWAFLGCMLLCGIANSTMRAPGVHLMLGQHPGDAGSASALITAAAMAMGSIGMVVVSLHLTDRVRIIGIMNLVVGLVCVILWFAVARRSLSPGGALGSAPDRPA